MNTARHTPERIDAGSAVIRVRSRDGRVQIEATVQGSGAASDRTLLFPAITPPIALRLAQQLAHAAAEAAQPALPYGAAQGSRQRFSSADVAEMRRLRAAGFKLKAIAERFRCAVSSVAYQTGGLIDPATNHATRRSMQALDAIVRLHADGMPVREIAVRLRCSESGVRAVIRRHTGDTPRPVPNPGPVHQLPLLFRPQPVPET